jgi:hypothetical protein
LSLTRTEIRAGEGTGGAGCQGDPPRHPAAIFGEEKIRMVIRIIDEASAEALLKAELLPPQHKPAHVQIRQQW